MKIIKNNCVNFKTYTNGLNSDYFHILQVNDSDEDACFFYNTYQVFILNFDFAVTSF